MADIIRSTLDWVIPDDIKGLEIAREYRTTQWADFIWLIYAMYWMYV